MVVAGRSLVAGLVHCARREDADAWQRLWATDPAVQTTAAAGVSALCGHLLSKIGELTGADPDGVLREFALQVAAFSPRHPPGLGEALDHDPS